MTCPLCGKEISQHMDTSAVCLVCRADMAPRCGKCSKRLGSVVSRPWEIPCGRCKTINRRD